MATWTSRRAFFAGLVGLQLLGLSVSALAAPDTLIIVPGITVTYPPSWSAAPSGYANALKLVNVPADQLTSPAVLDAARILITTETRLDQADAAERLRQISKELHGAAKSLRICGWPAVQGRYVSDRERRGQEGGEEEEGDGRPGKVRRVTTAVAVERLIVRFQGAMDEDASTDIADEMDDIAGSLQCEAPGGPGQVEKKIDRLRKGAPPDAGTAAESANRLARSAESSDRAADEGSSRERAAAPAVATGAQVVARNGSEVEIAASGNGQYVVVANNNGFAGSADGGQTFPTTGGIPVANCGDPSLAVGASGTFYYAFINATTGCAASFGNATGVLASTNNTGQAFTFRSNAVTCPATGAAACFPDQEHIAADRVNTGPGGGDQIYSTWRNFDSMDQDPAIVCSTDGGMNWSAPVTVAAGFVPRVTVGQDGFVYVVYLDLANATIMVQKYSSCASTPSLAAQAGFPRPVAAITSSATVTGVACPVPGVDRCNFRNRLTSYTAAVDDTNANHVYVAYADQTVAGNEDVMVTDSTDGGTTWSAPVRINANATGRRFMPWTCSLTGAVRVGWYDRRATVGAASNDLTDYYCGSASRSGANLVRGTETRVTAKSDPQCASGWPCPTDNMADSEQCMPTQPQLAGRCCFPAQPPCPGPGSGTACPGGNQALCPVGELCNANNVCCSAAQNGCAGTGSGASCDFSDGCGNPGGPGRAGEQCQVGRGCPKYGDYNGIACAAGRVFTAWASATPAQAPAGIYTFFNNKLAGAAPDLAVTKSDSPDPVIAGTDLTYTIKVTNNGPASAFQAVVSDAVPPNTTFRSVNAPGFTCTQPPFDATGTITCTKPFMAPNESDSITVVVHVAASTPGGATITNTANVSSADPDPNPANNSATATTAVITRADLSVSKLGMPNPVVAGTELTYELTATNLGPSDAQNVTIGDALPATTRFLSATPSAGGACTVPPVDGSGTVQCTYAGATPPDGTHSVMITVRVCADVLCGAAIADTGTTSSATTDPNPANNMASVMTAVQSQSDLSIEKVGGGIVSWGQIFEYTLTVHNAGVSTSHATTVVDTVPSAFEVLKASPSQGTCSVSPGNTVTCDLGDLGAANQCASFPELARVVISAKVKNVPPGPVDNTATVSSGNCLPDPNPGDNSASTTTTITLPTGQGMRSNVPAPLLSPLANAVLALALGLLAVRRLVRRVPHR